MKDFWKGIRGGLPIGLGYFPVSLAFGVAATQSGMPIWAAITISMTNLTSAGQLAGLMVIEQMGGFLEMALTQLIINLRYALMSITVSQKLQSGVRPFERLIMSFGVTDEIFAVSTGRKEEISPAYFYGLMTLPFLGWSLGTIVGASASAFLPESVLSALGIAIYGMFVAIVVPAMRKNLEVVGVVLIAVALSCLIEWAPIFSGISGGFAVIICAVIAAAIGAWLRPLED